MSKAWGTGSSRAWRRVRAFVLERDQWICRLCGERIPVGLAPTHPRAGTVHHIRGKRYGDDPRYLVAAHRECNQAVGDPTARDPAPRPVTQW